MENRHLERRHFLLELATKVIVGSVAIYVSPIIGCRRESHISSRTLYLKDSTYKIQNGVLTQSTKGEGRIKLGVLADLHAHQNNSQYFANQLNKENVDVFILPGDLSHSFGDHHGANDDYQEILDVVEPIADKGKLVLVTNGNHEKRKTYFKALKDLTSKYPNIIDMEETPVADLDDLTIIALGGIVNPRYCIAHGFLRTTKDFDHLASLARKHQTEKPLLIATHLPKRYSTKRGLDLTEKGINVGGIDLARIRKTIDSKFAVSGHIHEAFGIITPDEQPIKPGELSDKLDFNPGAVYDYLKRPYLRPAAGILEFIGNQARASIINR